MKVVNINQTEVTFKLFVLKTQIFNQISENMQKVKSPTYFLKFKGKTRAMPNVNKLRKKNKQ